jgi:DNA-binding transcriptional LysR family regulator
MMKFTLAQIEAFARIVENGSFHGAARQLNRTQPTVSQRVRELETAIGAPLFLRHGPRIQLTAEGHALIEYSRRLLGTANDISAHFGSHNPLKGVLRLGVPTAFALVCMTELLHRLDERYPELKTSMRVDDSGTMAQMLDEQELDVAILVEPVFGPHIRREPVGENGLAWMASTRLQLPGVASPADLAEMHIILPPPPSRLLATVMDWFSATGTTPNRVSTCNNFTVAIQTIASGLAIGVLPQRIMQDEIALGRVRPLTVAPLLPSNRVSICHQTGRLGPGLEQVVVLMRELMSKHRLFE